MTFADKMTFPQVAAWLNGSLYVMSPPGLWKLTDTTGSGVADKREMLMSGFDYSGNAADVHGPFAHPNGRLYWCHGPPADGSASGARRRSSQSRTSPGRSTASGKSARPRSANRGVRVSQAFGK